MPGIFATDSRRRRLLLALAIYLLAAAVYLGCAAPQTLSEHTPWNHFALLAEGWLNGRLDLEGAPPAYAGNNDFARVGDRWFVTFPPFPAVLLLPIVALAGSAADVRDGQFFIWLAGVAPAVLFLALEKMRRRGWGGVGTTENWLLAVLFAFGSVYFFSAVQGTVWFAAHVVAAALAALYLLFAINAERPILAGLMLGLGFMTRSPLIFAFPLFVFEAVRASCRGADSGESERRLDEVPTSARTLRQRVLGVWRTLDKQRLAQRLVSFALPIVAVMTIVFWHNQARFGDPFDFGYRHLVIAWRPRFEKWGLFHYHYLAKNLGVILTSLPYWTPENAKVPFQINAHGLALWFTTPLYLWLLWPRRISSRHLPLWLTVFAVAIPTLFYQNTGWLQFGYRFSNDYAVFLFALFALGGYRYRTLFTAAALWSVAINLFGALTFGRSAYAAYYYQDNTQKIFYQPD